MVHSRKDVGIRTGFMGLVLPLARMSDSHRRPMPHATFREESPRMHCEIGPKKAQLYSIPDSKSINFSERKGQDLHLGKSSSPFGTFLLVQNSIQNKRNSVFQPEERPTGALPIRFSFLLCELAMTQWCNRQFFARRIGYACPPLSSFSSPKARQKKDDPIG